VCNNTWDISGGFLDDDDVMGFYSPWTPPFKTKNN
jgi:hypothetical protein